MATTYNTDIQKLYVAYFNRPADYAGLQYWESVVEANKGNTAAVSSAFAASAEYTAKYGNQDNIHVVNAVYQNLFGHDADVAGLNFWATGLNNGTFTVAQAVTTIAAGAQGTDLTTFNNRVSAATAFTGALDTTAEILGYSGAAANTQAVKFLNGITTDASLTAATTPTALNNAIQGVINSTNGQTYTLTAGVDNLVGTSGNDVFNVLSVNGTTGATGSNLNAFDSIDGGNGIDTLNLYVTAASGTTPAANNDLTNVSITNIEKIVINGADNMVGGIVDASAFGGSTSITLNGGSTATVANVAAQTITLAGTTAGNVQFTSATTAGSIALTGANGTITATGAKLASLNVTGSVKAVSSTTPGTVTIVDGSATDTIKTLNLALTSAATVNVAGATALTTISAADSTGGLAFTGVPASVSSMTTGSGNDTVVLGTAFTSSVKTASVTTGAGNDDITVSTSGTGTFTVMAGDGNDTIHVASNQLVAGNMIDGGAGSDTIVMTTSSTFTTGDYTLINAAISNVETAEFAVGVTVNAAKLTQFDTLAFDVASTVTGATQDLVAHANLTASAAGYTAATASADSVYAGTLNVTTDAATSTLTLNADSAVVDVTATRGHAAAATINGDLQTSLTVNLTNTTNAASNPTADVLTTASITLGDGTLATDNASLKSIVLTGNGTVTIHAEASQSLTNIDASALGGTLATGTSTTGNITGGLVFFGNAAIAETITLGSGHDVINVASTVNHMDTIVNFDATQEGTTGASTVDTLVIGSGVSAVTLNGASASTAITKLTLASVDSTLDLAFVHAATASHTTGGVVQFTFGGDTYLFSDTTANGSVDNGDFAVKLVGTVDLTTAFATPATTV